MGRLPRVPGRRSGRQGDQVKFVMLTKLNGTPLLVNLGQVHTMTDAYLDGHTRLSFTPVEELDVRESLKEILVRAGLWEKAPG